MVPTLQLQQHPSQKKKIFLASTQNDSANSENEVLKPDMPVPSGTLQRTRVGNLNFLLAAEKKIIFFKDLWKFQFFEKKNLKNQKEIRKFLL